MSNEEMQKAREEHEQIRLQYAAWGGGNYWRCAFGIHREIEKDGLRYCKRCGRLAPEGANLRA